VAGYHEGSGNTSRGVKIMSRLGGEARWVDGHDPSRLAALGTTPAAPCWC